MIFSITLILVTIICLWAAGRLGIHQQAPAKETPKEGVVTVSMYFPPLDLPTGEQVILDVVKVEKGVGEMLILLEDGRRVRAAFDFATQAWVSVEFVEVDSKS